MGTEVLWPQDCLVDRFIEFPVPFCHRKNFIRNGKGSFYGVSKPSNGSGYRKPATRADRPDPKKRSINQQETPSISNRAAKAEESRLSSDRNNRSAASQLTILRRGESLDSLNSNIKRDHKSISSGKGSVQSESEMVLKQIPVRRIPSAGDVYAGSAFSMSPSPSSLPLPSFFSNGIKKQDESFDDSASRDLRRLLRLE